MKIFKPYLSLGKNTENYLLEVVFSTLRTKNIESIEQKEIVREEKTYWGVVVTLSSKIQAVNAPEPLILAASVNIDLTIPQKYRTIKCVIQQADETEELLKTSSVREETDIDFEDWN
ncbi:hypothetical protein [Gaoshiqia sp. Z1-71]|uniref:hypothetical protein n=1 Tax=Gaoshiqia hydrogeniformans TaxID=3290090 RepID=UPI003BF7878A